MAKSLTGIDQELTKASIIDWIVLDKETYSPELVEQRLSEITKIMEQMNEKFHEGNRVILTRTSGTQKKTMLGTFIRCRFGSVRINFHHGFMDNAIDFGITSAAELRHMDSRYQISPEN
jgi:hypothetical protein